LTTYVKMSNKAMTHNEHSACLLISKLTNSQTDSSILIG